jgi:quercetin dioxygenase-like cupin family protein
MLVNRFYDGGWKMPIIRSADVEFVPGLVENTRRRILVNPDSGSGAITLGELIMEPGAELPMHTHRVEETIVITKGEAITVLGAETYTLKPGDVILAPAGVKHMLANQGNEPMGFLFFYPSVEVRVERV